MSALLIDPDAGVVDRAAADGLTWPGQAVLAVSARAVTPIAPSAGRLLEAVAVAPRLLPPAGHDDRHAVSPRLLGGVGERAPSERIVAAVGVEEGADDVESEHVAPGGAVRRLPVDLRRSADH